MGTTLLWKGPCGHAASAARGRTDQHVSARHVAVTCGAPRAGRAGRQPAHPYSPAQDTAAVSVPRCAGHSRTQWTQPLRRAGPGSLRRDPQLPTLPGSLRRCGDGSSWLTLGSTGDAVGAGDGGSRKATAPAQHPHSQGGGLAAGQGLAGLPAMLGYRHPTGRPAPHPSGAPRCPASPAPRACHRVGNGEPCFHRGSRRASASLAGGTVRAPH